MNLESVQAVVAAAEAERSPVILAFSENAARYAGLGLLAAIGRELRATASVPVLLHFDHAESPEGAAVALELGFDAVVLESTGTADAMASLARRVVDADARGAVVEVECDVVAKGMRHRQSRRARPDEVARVARETGCALVAVDIGTEHKQRRKETRLDLEHVREVRAATDATIVLHGASGVDDDELRFAVAAGVGKVNVGTDLMLAFTGAVRSSLKDPSAYDLRGYLGHGRDAADRRVRSYLRILGSSGRAA